MKHVGFITSAQFPHLTDSDSLTIEPLKKRGIAVEPIIWSSPPPTLGQFDAVIMRSAWDYHLHIAQFTDWLNYLKENNIHVFNKIETMLWNSNKSYLLDLSKRGVSIVPTILVSSYDDIIFSHIQHWKEIVIKPTIGASAFNIKKLQTKNQNAIRREIDNLLSTGNVLIQPFMKEILVGEYSFIFFNKHYSHTVLKIPRVNEFRTQPEFGVTDSLVQPNELLINQAYEILAHIKEPLLYARIDAINVRGSLQLMELELIEPHLFLEKAPEKASMFADAIAQTI